VLARKVVLLLPERKMNLFPPIRTKENRPKILGTGRKLRPPGRLRPSRRVVSPNRKRSQLTLILTTFRVSHTRKASFTPADATSGLKAPFEGGCGTACVVKKQCVRRGSSDHLRPACTHPVIPWESDFEKGPSFWFPRSQRQQCQARGPTLLVPLALVDRDRPIPVGVGTTPSVNTCLRTAGGNPRPCIPTPVDGLEGPVEFDTVVDPPVATVSGGPSRLCPAFGPDYRGWLSGGFEAGLRASGLRIGPLGLSSWLPIWGFHSTKLSPASSALKPGRNFDPAAP
jgi:hypothetical protein